MTSPSPHQPTVTPQVLCSYSFRRLSFFGILNFLHNNATSSSPVCTLPKGFKDRRLQNKDLLTTYVLGFAGIVSSFLVFGCEFTCR